MILVNVENEMKFMWKPIIHISKELYKEILFLSKCGGKNWFYKSILGQYHMNYCENKLIEVFRYRIRYRRECKVGRKLISYPPIFLLHVEVS